MNLIYAPFVLLLSLLPAPPVKNNDNTAQGTYIVTVDAINNQGYLINYIKADSIFVYGNWGVETRIKTELVEINGVPQRRA